MSGNSFPKSGNLMLYSRHFIFHTLSIKHLTI